MLERQREGIAKAKSEGRYKGRKPIEAQRRQNMLRLAAEGATRAGLQQNSSSARPPGTESSPARNLQVPEISIRQLAPRLSDALPAVIAWPLSFRGHRDQLCQSLPWAKIRRSIREPDAREAHVWFDERDVKTERGRDNEAPATEKAGTDRPVPKHRLTSRLNPFFLIRPLQEESRCNTQSPCVVERIDQTGNRRRTGRAQGGGREARSTGEAGQYQWRGGGPQFRTNVENNVKRQVLYVTHQTLAP
jgi:hypothetical protein